MPEEIAKLSIPARIQLVEDIWDSIAAEGTEVPLTPAQREELQQRLERYRSNPEPGISWEALKASLQKRA